MTGVTGLDCAVMCNLINTHTHTHRLSGIVPRYLLAPSSRYVDLWRGWLRRACPHQGARHQTGRAQVGDTLYEFQHLAERKEVARIRRRFALVLQQALSFRTRHHLRRQGVALASTRQFISQGPVSVHAHRTEEVTRSEGREGANWVGDGIEFGGGNGDGNEVRGGNEDVNGDGDGDGAGAGAGTGTGVAANEGAQDGKEDGSGDGAGTGTGTGTGTGVDP